MQDEVAAILKAVRREIDLVLLPEVHSARARAVAVHIDTALRYLIMRREVLPQLMHDRIDACEQLLASSTDTGFEREGRNDIARNLLAHSHSLDEQLENELTRRSEAALCSEKRLGLIADEACVEAILSERSFITGAMNYEDALTHASHPSNQEPYAITADSLETYLSSAVPECRNAEVTKVERVLGGFSKDIYLVDLLSDGGLKGVVIRRDNPQGAIRSSVVDEFSLMRDLHACGIPVATPLRVETDTRIFGHPFLVLEKMTGTTVPSTTTVRVGQEHIAAAHGLAQVLARLHNVDCASMQLPASVYPGQSSPDYFIRLVDMWESTWRLDRTRPSPTIKLTFEWLRANAPRSQGPLRLVHGDAGLHNLLMDGQRVSAMLDWELVHLGEPAEDLLYARLWTDQILPWQDFLDHYHLHGGPRFSDENERFYEVLRLLRGIVTAETALRNFREATCPELLPLFAWLKYHRSYLAKLGSHIAALPAEAPDRGD